MQVHNLKSLTKNKTKKRVGRGGKRGTTSGRGTKGQKARAGRRVRPQYRDTLKKIPKKKGYNATVLISRIVAVNIRDIEKNFENGAKISPQVLAERGLVKRMGGRSPEIKILGFGNITKSFIFRDCYFSKSALEAATKAGCQIFPKKG